MLQETGEHVLITAGEVHLQRCLQDLRECYAKIQINASQPIVPFRETILAPWNSADSDATNRIQITTLDKRFSLKVRAASLPVEVVTLLEKNVDLIRSMRQLKAANDSLESAMANLKTDDDIISRQLRNQVSKFYQQLDEAFLKANCGQLVNKILAFGPRRCGPNVLLNLSSMSLPNVWDIGQLDTLSMGSSMLECLSSVINGFQLATLAGPLCEEPLMGVAYIVEEMVVSIDPLSLLASNNGGNNGESSSQVQQQFGPLAGQIMSAVKDGCRRAFQTQPQRLMAAMYNCSIQVSGEVVGK